MPPKKKKTKYKYTNKPTNPALYSRVKEEIPRYPKFDEPREAAI